MKYFDTNGTVFNKELYLENGKFVDPNFKYDDESTLYGFNKKIEKYKETNNKIYNDYKEKLTKLKNDIKSKGKIKWMRILDPESEVNKNFSEGKDNVDKALQGILGEYYLITYLNTLKKNNADIIFSLIKDFQVKIGYLEIIFYFKENEKIERKIVYVDDYLPFIEGSKLSNSSRAYTPLFTHSKNNRILENKIFLLIEKAYAKINGSYFCIINNNYEESIINNYMFSISGVEPKVEILNKIIIDYTKEKKFKIPLYENHKDIIIRKYLDNSHKIEILNYIKNKSDNNFLLLGPHDNSKEKQNLYGIISNYMYNYIKGEKVKNNKGKTNIFFWLFNPYRKNDLSKYNIYDEFNKINEENKNESKNGIIILNFSHFFKSFRRIIYQNRNEVKENYLKYKIESFLDSFNFDYNIKNKIIQNYIENIDYMYSLLSLLKLLEKNETIKNDILSDLTEHHNESDNSFYNSNKIEYYISKMNSKTIVDEPPQINSYELKHNLREKKVGQEKESWRRYINKSISIRSIVGYKNLDIEGGNEKRNGIKIILWDAHGEWNQKFKMLLNTDGTVTFVNGEFAIDAYGGEADNGTQINIWERNGSNAQKFYIEDIGNDNFRIHSAIDEDYCIDVNEFSPENGTKIQLWKKNDSIAQIFKFIE